MPFIAFFSVIPFESDVLTLYKSPAIASALMLALRFAVLAYACFIILKKRPFTDDETKMLIRYTAYFIFTAMLNAWSTFFASEDFSFGTVKTVAVRTMSIVCVWGFLVCCMYFAKDGRIYYGITFSAASMILLSGFAFIFMRERAMSIESSSETVFKGVAGNRNSYVIYVVSLFIGLMILLYKYISDGKSKICFKTFFEKKNIFFTAAAAASVLIAFATQYLTKSSTGLLITCALLILFAFYTFGDKKFPVWLIPAIYGFVWLIIGVIGIDKIIPSKLFESVFHKSITLSYRTVLWEAGKKLSVYSLLTGFGFDNTYLADMHIVSSSNSFINDPHNSVLYILLTQGIIGFAAWLYMICSPLVKASKIRKNKTVTYLLIFIAIMIWRGLVESAFHYTNMMLWAMVIALEVECEKNNSGEVMRV